MLSLSPAKILVVLVVALIVLGPDKLPGVARQMGALWGEVRRLRTRLESEVREVLPDLPPAHELTRAIRSPLTFLDRLADEHERAQSGGPGPASSSPSASSPAPSGPLVSGPIPSGRVNGAGSADGATRAPPPADALASVPDDPSMN